MKQIIYILFLFLFLNCSSDDSTVIKEEATSETIYFPPINNAEWETKSITDLNWNENQLQPLLDFLEEKNTKGFIILHQGKIVIEEYFNGHSDATSWYWASAGKTLTSTLAGIAQEENLININNKVSDYLGVNWTSLTLEKENLITCKHLLSMSSGLDDSIGDVISPDNLQYIADAGTRWAYHNVYVKIQDVISAASQQNFSTYFNTKLRDRIGMTGIWTKTGSINVYWSNSRSMARFGLLISAKGKWENTQIISESFIDEATNTSQNINLAYGYLWWLNGKSTYKLPQTQFLFQGSLIPNAPNDLFCALGKNDQKIYIVPSKDLVVIRIGDSADDSNFALSTFDDELWKKINALLD